MKTKILASLTAVLLAMTAVSSVSAEESEIQPAPWLENGRLTEVFTKPQNGILIQTDGTALTEDMVSHLEGYQEMMTWDDFVHSFTLYLSTENNDDISNPDNTYWVALDTADRDEQKLIGRTVQQELACAEEVYLIDVLEYHNTENGFNFCLYATDDAPVFDANTIPELAEDFYFGDSFTGETIFSDESGTYYFYEFIGELEGNDLFCGITERSTASISYEVYLSWIDFIQSIVDKYPDIVKSGRLICFTNAMLPAVRNEYEAPSVWSTAGDHNADGEVNSNDAADLLVQAAQDGVAEASAAAVSPDSDVNLDGVADSTDAAYILQYAALKGSGAEADWVEILKK